MENDLKQEQQRIGKQEPSTISKVSNSISPLLAFFLVVVVTVSWYATTIPGGISKSTFYFVILMAGVVVLYALGRGTQDERFIPLAVQLKNCQDHMELLKKESFLAPIGNVYVFGLFKRVKFPDGWRDFMLSAQEENNLLWKYYLVEADSMVGGMGVIGMEEALYGFKSQRLITQDEARKMVNNLMMMQISRRRGRVV